MTGSPTRTIPSRAPTTGSAGIHPSACRPTRPQTASIDSNGDDYVKDDRAIAKWTSTIGAWATNEARFIFSRDFEFEFPTPSLPGEPVSSLGYSPEADIFGCGYGASGTTLACTYYIGTPYYLDRYDYPDERRIQGADTFSISKGKHLIKFGFDLIRTSDLLNAYVSGDQFGEYEYNDLGDYISDYLTAVDKLPNACLSSAGASIPCWDEYLQTVGPLKFTVPTLETGLFIQDDWRVLPRFTLNLGLRWDHEALPSPVLPNPAIPQTEPRFPATKRISGRVSDLRGTLPVRGTPCFGAAMAFILAASATSRFTML